MSYTGLIAEANHAQTRGKELLDQVVLFNVERGAANMSDGSGLHQRSTIALLDKRSLTGFPDAVGDHIHCRFEFQVLPDRRARTSIPDLGQAIRVCQKLVAGR